MPKLNKSKIHFLIVLWAFFIFLSNTHILRINLLVFDLARAQEEDNNSAEALVLATPANIICRKEFSNENSVLYRPQLSSDCFGGGGAVLPICGNGILENAEQCDGNLPVSCVTASAYNGTKTCQLPTFPPTSTLNCHWQGCQSTEYCGDNIVNGPEECDAGSGASSTCTSSCLIIAAGGGGGGSVTSVGGGSGIFISGPSNIKILPQCLAIDLSWITSDVSVSWLVYGTKSGLYQWEYKDDAPKTGHTIHLSDLQSGIIYYYRVKMITSGGVIYSSEEKIFSTKADCPVPPQILGNKIVAERQCVLDWRGVGPNWSDKDVLGQTVFPEGSLLRACRPAIYHLENGHGRYVKTWRELFEHFFGQRIYNVQDEVLDLYL